jgi:hypothetical protein
MTQPVGKLMDSREGMHEEARQEWPHPKPVPAVGIPAAVEGEGPSVGGVEADEDQHQPGELRVEGPRTKGLDLAMPADPFND